MAKSYLQRSMEVLKANQLLVEKVEYFNSHSCRRHDLYGFLDILGVHPAFGTVGVQVCGPGDFGAHEKKILGERREALIHWLIASPHNRCLLMGWRNLKKTKTVAGGWTPRIREFTLDDLPEITGNILAKLHDSPGPDTPEWLWPKPTDKRYFSYI